MVIYISHIPSLFPTHVVCSVLNHNYSNQPPSSSNMAEYDTAMPRVLAISEILDTIMSFSDLKTAARCARVCKLWSDIALNRTWHSVSSENNLLECFFGRKIRYHKLSSNLCMFLLLLDIILTKFTGLFGPCSCLAEVLLLCKKSKISQDSSQASPGITIYLRCLCITYTI